MPITDVSVDVLIVGSGPIGSTFARLLTAGIPTARVIMVDAGPQLTPLPGMNVKNLTDAGERRRAQRRAEGPNTASQPDIVEAPGSDHYERARGTVLARGAASIARPGTHLVPLAGDATSPSSGMPAAALSTNVGGMGAHWTCACPRPAAGERIGLIPQHELDAALARAERLLGVTSDAFAGTPHADAIVDRLGAMFDDRLPPGRKVQAMPLACRRRDDGVIWWMGSDAVLGPLARPAPQLAGRFELRQETLCTRLLVRDNTVVAALLEHLPSGRRTKVSADVFVIAADALRTPQLLWASGIRPQALGHHLNDQPQVLSAVRIDRQLIGWRAHDALREAPRRTPELTMGIFWIPFDAGHPFHGQVMHLDASPIPFDHHDADPEHVLALSWYCTKQIRFEDRVEFSDHQHDPFGMPHMTIRYGLTAEDHKTARAAIDEQRRVAAVLGTYVDGDEPQLLPAGSSLHYQGTVRMGAVDDGSSVCDTNSRVWGIRNLFVGGNGVIPTATACNPTLTSVALAVRSCDHIIGCL